MLTEPARIAILIGQLGNGGGERQLSMFIRHIDRDRFEPVIVTFNPDRGDVFEREIQKEAVRILGVPRGALARRFIGATAMLGGIRPRLVHAWDTASNPAAAWCGLAARVGIRLGSVRSNLFWRGRRRTGRWLSHAGLDFIVCNSSNGMKDLLRLGYPKECAEVVYNGVEVQEKMDEGRRATLRRAWGLPESCCAVCIVGGLKAVKNQTLLLDSLASGTRGNDELHAVLIGDGPDRGRLENRARELGIEERVHFLGAIPDAKDVLGAADIMCLTSLSEGMPGVLLEGAMASLPLVATDVGGVNDIVEDGKSGFVMGLGDVLGLAERLATLQRSRELRESMGMQARERALKCFSSGQMAERMMGVYGRLLGSTQPRGITDVVRVQSDQA